MAIDRTIMNIQSIGCTTAKLFPPFLINYLKFFSIRQWWSIFDSKLIFDVGNNWTKYKYIHAHIRCCQHILITISASDFDNTSKKSTKSIRFNNVPQTISLTNIIQHVLQVVGVSIDNISNILRTYKAASLLQKSVQ